MRRSRQNSFFPGLSGVAPVRLPHVGVAALDPFPEIIKAVGEPGAHVVDVLRQSLIHDSQKFGKGRRGIVEVAPGAEL